VGRHCWTGALEVPVVREEDHPPRFFFLDQLAFLFLQLHRFASLSRDDAGVDAEPADFAEEAAVLDLGAAVLDDVEAGGFGLGGGFVVADAELQPEDLGTDPDRGVGDGGDVGGFPEDLDHVGGLRQGFEALVDGAAEDFLARVARVDGVDLVALVQKIEHGEVGGAHVVG